MCCLLAEVVLISKKNCLFFSLTVVVGARLVVCAAQFQSNESGFFFKKDTLKYSFSQMSHKFQSNESASGFAGADFIRLFRSL